MPIIGQDNDFYLTDTGGRIAKSGLSADKNKSYQDILATMAPAQAPMMSTLPAAQLSNPFESPAGDLTSLSQLNLGASPPGQASLGQTPQVPTQPMPGISPEITKMYESGVADINAGINQQMLGNQKAANAETAATIEINKQSQELTKQLEAQNNEMRLADLRRQQAMYDTEQNINTTLQEYDAAKINPDRFFEGKTGKRLLAGIAIAFGEIGRALSGGQSNTALNIINQAIESDIEAQKENRTALAGKLTAQRQILSDMRTRLGDEQQSMLAQKVITIEMAQRKIDETARRFGTEKAQANALVLNGALQQKKGELLTTLMNNAAEKAAKVTPGGLTSDQVKTVSDMSSAYEKNDGIASYNKIDLAFNKMEKLAEIAQKNPNAAQAIITTFNRVLDENSVVREAEVNLTMQAGSVVDRFKQQAEKLATGVMTPKQVSNLVEAARQLKDAALEGKQRVDARFKQRADAFGVPSNLIIAPSPVTQKGAQQELSSLTIEGQPEKQRTKSANVMPGR